MAGKRTFAPRTFSAWTFASGHWAGVGAGVAFTPVVHYHTLEGPSRQIKTLIGPDKTIMALQGPSKQVRVLAGSK